MARARETASERARVRETARVTASERARVRARARARARVRLTARAMVTAMSAVGGVGECLRIGHHAMRTRRPAWARGRVSVLRRAPWRGVRCCARAGHGGVEGREGPSTGEGSVRSLGLVLALGALAVTGDASLARVKVGAAAAALLAASVRVVGQGDGALVERLGRFHRKLDPGLHLVIPFVEWLSATDTLREKVLDVPPMECITADNTPLTADAVVYYRITDLYATRYSVESLVTSIENLVLTQLRTEVGKLTLDDTFSARQALNAALLAELDAVTPGWGVRITRVVVRDILPAASIKGALEQQMTAERERRAAILRSEGDRMAAVNRAKGAAEAAVLEATASADSRALNAAGLARAVACLRSELALPASSDAERLYLADAYVRAMHAVGTGPGANTLFMDPASIPGTLAGVASLLTAAPGSKSAPVPGTE